MFLLVPKLTFNVGHNNVLLPVGQIEILLSHVLKMRRKWYFHGLQDRTSLLALAQSENFHSTTIKHLQHYPHHA